uniref:Homer scaffold protein 1b n=1 Tax=Paramormyrops kingsleyae TaxID=1676925 RepID=A0A3B3TDD3_9TELE
MTFTKTSQKFGQWADSRANTVYGLGFSSENHLLKFAEKFAEFKEAARLAKEKSQEKMELTSTPSQESATGDVQAPLTPESINGTDDERATPDATPNSEPRPEPSQNALPFSHSAAINKHWEAELAALKGNNAKLTAALLESTANVKQWKQQLAAYQEEAERLHKRVTELECVSGQTNVIKSHKTELNQTIEELESTLKAKEKVSLNSRMNSGQTEEPKTTTEVDSSGPESKTPDQHFVSTSQLSIKSHSHRLFSWFVETKCRSGFFLSGPELSTPG